MCEQLAEHGIHQTPTEVRSKIHNFIAKYRKYNTAKESASAPPSDWPFYSLVHKILGSYAKKNLEKLSLDVVNSSEESAMTESSRASSSCYDATSEMKAMPSVLPPNKPMPQNATKHSRRIKIDKILADYEDCCNVFKIMMGELVAIEKERLKLEQRRTDSFCELTEHLMQLKKL